MQNRIYRLWREKVSPFLPSALKESVVTGWRELQELKDLTRDPRSLRSSLGLFLDERSPWLGRRFLGVASNWIEPFTVGMGFRVHTVSEDVIEVGLPGGWRNQGEGGAVHSAALSALADFAVRLYWEHHLDLRYSGVESRRVQVRLLARPIGAVKAVFRLPVGDREAILHRLRSQNHAETETQTQIYDCDGRLVAEVDADWQLSRRLTLGSRATRA